MPNFTVEVYRAIDNALISVHTGKFESKEKAIEWAREYWYHSYVGKSIRIVCKLKKSANTIEQTVNWISISDAYPELSGTYLVAIRCPDGKIRSHIGLFVHPRSSPYAGLDWRDIPYEGYVEFWAALPKLENL